MSSQNLAIMLLNRRKWFRLFLLVSGISIAGLIYLGGATYTGAPPLENFESSSGDIVISRDQIQQGEEVFHTSGIDELGIFSQNRGYVKWRKRQSQAMRNAFFSHPLKANSYPLP